MSKTLQTLSVILLHSLALSMSSIGVRTCIISDPPLPESVNFWILPLSTFLVVAFLEAAWKLKYISRYRNTDVTTNNGGGEDLKLVPPSSHTHDQETMESDRESAYMNVDPNPPPPPRPLQRSLKMPSQTFLMNPSIPPSPPPPPYVNPDVSVPQGSRLGLVQASDSFIVSALASLSTKPTPIVVRWDKPTVWEYVGGEEGGRKGRRREVWLERRREDWTEEWDEGWSFEVEGPLGCPSSS